MRGRAAQGLGSDLVFRISTYCCFVIAPIVQLGGPGQLFMSRTKSPDPLLETLDLGFPPNTYTKPVPVLVSRCLRLLTTREVSLSCAQRGQREGPVLHSEARSHMLFPGFSVGGGSAGTTF